MALVLVLAAALWTLGWLVGAPNRARFLLLALLWAGVVLAHVALPDGHALRQTLGGSAAPWLILGGLVALGLLYARFVAAMKGRAQAREAGAAPDPAQQGPFSDTELERYARHIVLREVGGPGQRKLKDARVLMLGAGGLGAPALQYLAAAGVGTLGVIDDDEVSLSNLQRQVIHTDARIGMPKVFSAEAALRALNPHIEVRPYHRRFEPGIARDLVSGYDMVLDGSDNFDARYLANEVCTAAGVPLVSGALSQWEGQLSVFDPARGAPCYACVFPSRPAEGLAPSCAEAGVMGALPGVVGAMMAGEAIKLITGAGAPLRGEMLIYDALWSETRKLTLKRAPDCPVCGGGG